MKISFRRKSFWGCWRKQQFADARAVIHLGACSATTEKDADYLLRNNYQYTRVLCNWAWSMMCGLCMRRVRRRMAMVQWV